MEKINFPSATFKSSNQSVAMKDYIIITSPEKLKELFREVYREEQQNEQKYDTPKSLNQKTYSRKETAEILHITLPTLNKYVKDGSIICYRIGNRVLFKAKDIEAAMVKRKFR